MIGKAREVLSRLSGPSAVAKMEKRISAMPTNALVDWCETGAAGLGAAISAWERAGRPEDLLEAQSVTAQLGLALDELGSRVL